MLKKKPILFAVIAVILVLLLEVIVRITYKEKFNRYVSYPVNYQPDSLIGFTFIPNSSFTINGTRVNINSEGFIGKEFSREKEKGVYRIVVVGACGVSGTVNLNFYSNFTDKLQALFIENGRKVEIINCGLDGDGRSYENFTVIKDKVLNYNPDLILADISLPFISYKYTREEYKGYLIEYPLHSDRIREESKKKIDKLFTPEYAAIRKLYDISYTVKAIHNFFWHRNYETELTELLFIHKTRKYTNGHGRATFWTYEKSAELMADMKEELTRKGTNIYYLTYYINEEEGFYQSYQLPLISLFKDFDSSMYFHEDSHFGPKGYEDIGKRLYTILTKEKNIIPVHNVDYSDKVINDGNQPLVKK